MTDSLPALTRCRRRSPLPDCIRDILENPNEPCTLPPELEKTFSKFSFGPSNSNPASFSKPISLPCSPMTRSVQTFTNEDFELLDLSPCSSSSSAATNTTATSASLVSRPASSVVPSSLSSSSSPSQPSFRSSSSSFSCVSSTSSVVSYHSQRRSDRESTYLELDMLNDDVRRVRDGMHESLNRYFGENSFYAFYAPSAYFRLEFPWWHKLKYSLNRLISIMADLLTVIEGDTDNNYGIDEEEKEGEEEKGKKKKERNNKNKETTQKLSPILNRLSKEGIEILKIWNARDEKLSLRKSTNPDGFISMTPRERKAAIRGTKNRVVHLNRLVDDAFELVKLVLVARTSFDDDDDGDDDDDNNNNHGNDNDDHHIDDE